LAGAEHTTLEDKCSSQGCTQADIDASSGPGLQTAGQVLFGVAGAAAVATVILFFVESDSAEETLVAGPSGVGLRF
ncbi:MAG: hypothetical protein KC416_11930, partial [Myxococcales bacterium]|nr:hypothetical protein [Myxococcales bacterium]